jgi:hypothetical protein
MIKKIPLFFLLICGANISPAQTEMAVVGLKSVLQADLHNPALFRQEGFHLGLPSASYNFFHTGAGLGSILDRKVEPPLVNLSALEKELSSANYLISDFRLQTFKAKWVRPRWAIGLEHEITFHSNISYPDDLIRLFLKGNQQYIGQSVAIAPAGTIYSYNSYGLSFSYSMPRVTLGFRSKLLAGNHFANTPRASATLHTDSDIYQLSLDTDYRFDNVGVLSFEQANFLNYKIDLAQPWKLFSRNRGFAFDLGLDFQVTDDFNVAVSVLDLGSIVWSEGARSYISNDIWHYDGLKINDLFNVEQIDIVGALDSLSNLFSLVEESGSITYHLPTKWVGLTSYQLNEMVNISLITHYDKATPDPLSISLMATSTIKKWITLGAIFGNRFAKFNFGLNAVITHDWWQAFVGFDNITAGLSPISSNNYQVRLGLNLHFGQSSSD